MMDFFTSDQDLNSSNSLFTDGETTDQGQFFSNDYDVVPIYSEEEASEIITVQNVQQDIVGQTADESEEIVVVLQEIKDILVSSNEHLGESETTEGNEEEAGTDNNRTDSRSDTDGIERERSGNGSEGTGEAVIEGETESTTLDQTLHEISQKLDSIYNCQLEQSRTMQVSNSNSVIFYQVNVALLSFILGGIVAHSFLGKIR